MKDDDALPVSTPTSSSVLSSSSVGIFMRDSSSDASGLFGRGRYKFWALAAILLLAFWSMLTGTVSLRRSAGDLTRFNEDYDSPAIEYLDVLVIYRSPSFVDIYTYLCYREGFSD